MAGTNSWLIASLSGALLLTSCTTESEADLCARASTHIQDCFGTELNECSADTAVELLDQTCDEITASADSAKADGYCPSFLWWICNRNPEPECPSSGSSSEYAQMSNAQQMNYHWEWMECTEYGVGNNPEFHSSGWDLLTNAALGAITSIPRLGRTFSNTTDELDQGRVKLIHPYGTVAQVEFIRNDIEDASCNVDYTGILAEERVPGLARLGWGADPRAIGYVPGMGIKFFVEGADSVNLQVINTLDGDRNAPNFFAKTLTNILPTPQSVAIKPLVALFGLFADEPLHLRLEHIARVETDGSRVSSGDVVAAERISFVPTTAAFDLYQNEIDGNSRADFRDVFARFPAGTVLYDVYAQAQDGSCDQLVGTLVTTTDFRTSSWNDENLYFQHAIEGQGYN
jgi:hypothetical protein